MKAMTLLTVTLCLLTAWIGYMAYEDRCEKLEGRKAASQAVIAAEYQRQCDALEAANVRTRLETKTLLERSR